MADANALSETFFQVEKLTFAHKGAAPLFDAADFVCGIDERVGILADNGTGKTTFLRILTGLMHPTSMRLRCLGREIKEVQDFAWLRTRAGFVLQNADDQLFFPEVIDDLMFGPMNLGKTENEAKAVAKEVLADLGIETLAQRDSFTLSGGQKRLVSLACVLAMRPVGLLLDEPTTGLDAQARDRLNAVLLAFKGPQIMVSHDAAFLQTIATRLVTIQNARFETIS